MDGKILRKDSCPVVEVRLTHLVHWVRLKKELWRRLLLNIISGSSTMTAWTRIIALFEGKFVTT
jgi:hypothetical protein